MDDRLRRMIASEEGVRYKPYLCSEGKLTIGIGRNLEDNGLTEDEVMYLFENDLVHCRDAAETLPGWRKCNGPRAAVLISMVFQMGIHGVRKFRLMLRAIEAEEWEDAYEEMLDSKWARQTPARAERHAEQMRTGKWQD